MVKGILSHQLAKAVLFVLIGLVLYGVYSGTALAAILVLFVALRFTYLAAEAMRKPVPAERWTELLDELIQVHEQSTPEERAAESTALNLAPRTSSRELARAQVNNAMRRNPPPRQKRELAAEALGVVAFAVLLPATLALYSRDFFSLRTPQGWAGTAVIALCLAMYGWPHRWQKTPRFANYRILWWASPFFPCLFLVAHAIETRHLYLNPFHPDHARLAAERVLALTNNVIAGRHADWVLRYARQLDERAQPKEAAYFYREGLRLDANDRHAYERFTFLETQSSGDPVGIPPQLPAAASPFWTVGEAAKKSPRCRIDSQLENVEKCTVVMVAVGDVSDEILDAVGDVVRKELDLPVLISSNSVPLPPHTRVRGLVTGRQWDQTVLLKAVQRAFDPFPKAPIKYVLITSVDIYAEEVNYLFSGSYEWGALVSFARFGEPKGSDSLLRHRTAKQTLCALIKSFKVPMSPDRNCVTSYTRSLEEFDAKGNRPNAETLALFRRAVADLDKGWQEHKALQRGVN